MKHTAIAAVMLGGLMTFLGGCEKKAEDYIDKEFRKIVYFNESGVVNKDLLVFGDTQEIDITINKGGYDSKEAASVTLGGYNDQQMEQFASLRGWNVVEIPSGCYKLDRDVNFSDGEEYKIVKIIFDIKTVKRLIAGDGGEDVHYILPLVLEGEDGLINKNKDEMVLDINMTSITARLEKTGYKYEEVDFSDGGDTYTFEQTVTLNFDAVEDMELQVALSPEALEAYNKENGTSLEIMDDDAYSFERTLYFRKGEREQKFGININKEALSFDEISAIPIRIESNNGDVTVDKANSEFIYAVKYIPLLRYEDLSAEKVEYVGRADKRDKTGDNEVTNLWDGNEKTFVSGKPDGSEHYLKFTLPKEAGIIAFEYQTLTLKDGWGYYFWTNNDEWHIDVLEDDGTTWTTVWSKKWVDGAELKDGNLLYNNWINRYRKGEWYTSPVIRLGRQAKVFRLYAAGYNELNLMNQAGKYGQPKANRKDFSFAEFKLRTDRQR